MSGRTIDADTVDTVVYELELLLRRLELRSDECRSMELDSEAEALSRRATAVFRALEALK